MSSSLYADRLQALRTEIRKLDLDGFLVPMADEYQNEYIPDCAKRIEFLSGFTGSSAFIVVLANQCGFFTDSRYTLQASQQIQPDLFTIFDIAQKTPTAWLKETLKPQMKIGFDPRLHTMRQIERMELVLIKSGASVAPVDSNPLDQIWTDRPAPPIAPIVLHDTLYTGRTSSEKRIDLAEELKKKSLNAALITDPASVAWLLNVRGGDVPHTPLPLSSAILRSDATVEWFVDARKITKGLEKFLGAEITRHDVTDLPAALKRLGEARCRVLVDPDETSYDWVMQLRQTGATIENGEDPCILPRAKKNNSELDGMRAAHRRDGAAMVKFLAWLDASALSGKVTELDAEEKLAAFRAEGSLYRGPSFSTIAASGPNGAIVHYRAVKETNRLLDRNSFFLLDSGAQYLDGTTDITRTIVVGEVTNEMKDRFTRVLKGHIALSTIRFPEGTSGADLDVLARQFLWSAGLDYGHGTGHGVGSYLGVHEGPQSISKRGSTSLATGMVLSNEPGYYKARHYGIRIENLQTVIDCFEISTPELKMLGFEPLTLVPYDRRAIAMELLSPAEIAWINAYHTRVHKALRPQLDGTAAAWLEQATAPL